MTKMETCADGSRMQYFLPTIFQTHLLISKRTLGQLRWQLTLHQLSRGAFEAELPVCLTRKHRWVGFTLRRNVRPDRLSKWNLNLKPQILLYGKPFCTLALRKRKICRRIKVSLVLKWKKNNVCQISDFILSLLHCQTQSVVGGQNSQANRFFWNHTTGVNLKRSEIYYYIDFHF